jgi:hypothetical protein
MKSGDSPPPGASHAEAQQLLPWLVAGTLAGAERERVQDHLALCAACRADLAREGKLRAAGGQDPPALDAGQAFARLLPQLGPQVAPQPERGRPRPRPAANDGWWLRPFAAAQGGVIAVLALLLLRPAGEASYQALGPAAVPQASVVVTFSPDAPERELRRIAEACGARFVDGPTVTGSWLLAVAGRQHGTLECLRAQRAVTLAEPLLPQASP